MNRNSNNLEILAVVKSFDIILNNIFLGYFLMSDILKHLSSLSVCTILTTGRTVSDLLQRLLDSHHQVLTFNSNFQFHLF